MGKALVEGARKEVVEREEAEIITPERVGESHVWLFPGFEDGENRWLEAVRKAYSDETDSDHLVAPNEGDRAGEIGVPVQEVREVLEERTREEEGGRGREGDILVEEGVTKKARID